MIRRNIAQCGVMLFVLLTMAGCASVPLDDVFTSDDDAYFSFMNAHPNVEVHIFNPISRKGIYAFNDIGNFGLANRRLHNKSFIVDNQVAVVGGRAYVHR